jgi:hypothetical protein
MSIKLHLNHQPFLSQQYNSALQNQKLNLLFSNFPISQSQNLKISKSQNPEMSKSTFPLIVPGTCIQPLLYWHFEGLQEHTKTMAKTPNNSFPLICP